MIIGLANINAITMLRCTYKVDTKYVNNYYWLLLNWMTLLIYT